MKVDVDAWALDCRAKITKIFCDRGELVPGAFILATLDPTTGDEFETPETWTQLYSDYETPREFSDALRVQCLRTGALGTVVFALGMRYANARPVYPILCFAYERRGRVRTTRWTARVGRDKTLGEFTDSSTIAQFESPERSFPTVD